MCSSDLEVARERNNMMREVYAARQGAAGNKMDQLLFKAQSTAQTKAVEHTQKIINGWGGILPKSYKEQGFKSVEDVRPLLEKQYTKRFLPGAMSLANDQEVSDKGIDLDLFRDGE